MNTQDGFNPKSYQWEPLYLTLIKASLLVGMVALTVFGESEETKSLGAVGAGIVFLFTLLIPAYNWHRDQTNAREYLRQEAFAITDQVMVIKARTEQIKENQRLVQAIRWLPTEYIKIAEKILTDEALFVIDGDRVAWKVNGTQIPIWFAEMWWENYEKQPEGHLPPISSFIGGGAYTREEQRAWCKALTERLVQFGVVRWPGSQFPARWMVTDEKTRSKTLAFTGLPWAIRLCEFLKEEGSEA